eukprot:s1350_g19.t1
MEVDRRMRSAEHIADKRVEEAEYKSGLRAGAPTREAVKDKDGVVFIRTASDGVLTKDTIDPKFIISIEDTVNNKFLHQRKDTVQASAKSSGDGAKVGQLVRKIEGKAHSLAQSSASASAALASNDKSWPSSHEDQTASTGVYWEGSWTPGYADRPKADVPKAGESPKAKAPKPLPSPPTGPPPQKKAAIVGEPKAVPAAQPVKIMEQKAKTPPEAHQSQSSRQHLRPPKPKQKGLARKSQKGWKLGLKQDFKGDFLRQLTRDQLASLGVTDTQDRGSTSPEADLLKRAKERLKRALGLGYTSVLDRFIMNTDFTESVLNDGENEYDCERFDLFAKCHLTQPDRSKTQVRLGNSENGQLEHMAAKLVYIDVAHINVLPDRFHYMGQPWMVM